jgi:hypothetical protein
LISILLEKKKAGERLMNVLIVPKKPIFPILAAQSADAKASGVTILSFGNNQDRDNFASYWHNNSGMNKGKSCQLGTHLSTTPKASFKKIYEAGLGMNHKGKMN